MTGAIGPALLSRVRASEQFKELRERLLAFTDVALDAMAELCCRFGVGRKTA